MVETFLPLASVFAASSTSFPGILPNDLNLLSLEQENVTVTRSIYQEIFM